MHKVVTREDGRFVIIDATTKKVLDDAQGYGYTTKRRAERAAWYRFKGGKAKKDSAKRKAARFWRGHKEFAGRVEEFFETWFKEIARGEVDSDAEIAAMATEMGVVGFDPKFLEYL